MENKNKKNALHWIYSYSKQYLWMIFLMALISTGIAAGFIALAVVSKQILDTATGNQNGNLLGLCLTLLAIIAGQGIGNIINSNIRVRSQTNIENKMRSGLLGSLMKKKYQKILGIHSGELMNRLSSDVEIVAGGIVGLIPQVFSLFTKIIAGLGVMAVMDWKFTVVILLAGAVMAVLSRLYSKKFRFLHKEVQRTVGITKSFMQECLENILVIKSFVGEKSALDELAQKQKKTYQIRVKQNMISNIAHTSIYIMTVTGYYTALAWGAVQISKGILSFGTLTAFLQILDQIKAPFRNISGIIPRYDSMIASAERLMELEELEEDEIQSEIEDVSVFYEEMEEICLENCSFAYDDKEVLKDLSVTFPKGEVTALIGESGNGKSTLFHLLLGLFEVQKGEIFFQTSKGKQRIHAGTRKMFAYVPQGNMILSGTIRENILFGNTKADEERIDKALEISCLTEVIKELPDGLDTVLGERGIGLSEGQRQRIAIARALVSDAPILLLDECTSALDLNTEKNLLSNLRTVKGKTVICISHREAAMEACDNVVSLENGTTHIFHES